MDHSFCVEVARDFKDSNVAILVHNLKFWTNRNLANKKHIYDGHCWIYNSVEAWIELFPYWSKKNMQTIIKNAIKYGLIIKGNYNSTKYDRTCWYALTPKAFEYYPEINNEKYLNLLNPLSSQNREMEFPQSGNRFPTNGQPIPDSKPDNKPITNTDPVLCSSDDERTQDDNCLKTFEKFWELYPRKDNKKNALKIWKKEKLYKYAENIANDIKFRMSNKDEWGSREKKYIPMPATYLTQERWNDNIEANQPKPSFTSYTGWLIANQLEDTEVNKETYRAIS